MMTCTQARSVTARLPNPPLVAFRKWWIGLEIGARQVVEQHVVADVEQIAPPPHQMIEDRLLAPAAGRDSGTACGFPPARHLRPAGRPERCAETTHDADAIRCPAPAGGKRPARTAPDPNASLCGSLPAASTRTDRAAARATAAALASTRPTAVADADAIPTV